MADSQVTVESIVDLNIPKEVRISPSGHQVVYTLKPATKKSKHPVSSIWLADIGKEYPARQITSGLFNDAQP
jgi:hypothetical protein